MFSAWFAYFIGRWEGYNLQKLRGDIFGGVTSGVVALPVSLALGVAAVSTAGGDVGQGALAGLYGAIAVGVCAALFGGTPAQVSGPTPPMAIAMAVVVAQKGLEEAFAVVLLAGLFQIAFGVLRVGRFISYTPYSVISGFMSGIGMIIIVIQLLPFFGFPVQAGRLTASLEALPDAIRELNIDAFGVALFTLGLVVFWPRRFRGVIPPTLAALVLGTGLSLLWLDGAPTIGDIPTGFPSLQWPDWSLDFVLAVIEPAFIIALLGSIDSLLTSLVADSLTRTTHRPNRELFGQGLGNTLSGLIGGLPGAGMTLTTVVNVRAGGRTPLAGILVAVVLLALAMGGGAIAEPIPHAVLAGILLKVGWDIIDWRFLRRIRDIQGSHLLVMFMTVVLTMFVDLVTAVAIGLIAAGMANALRSERFELDNVLSVPLLDLSGDDPYSARTGLLALRGRFSVASSSALVRAITPDIQEHEVVIFDFSRTTALDDSAAMVIKDLVEGATEQGTQSIAMGLEQTPSVESALDSLGALDDIPPERRVETLVEARELADALLAERDAAEAAQAAEAALETEAEATEAEATEAEATESDEAVEGDEGEAEAEASEESSSANS